MFGPASFICIFDPSSMSNILNNIFFHINVCGTHLDANWLLCFQQYNWPTSNCQCIGTCWRCESCCTNVSFSLNCYWCCAWFLSQGQEWIILLSKKLHDTNIIIFICWNILIARMLCAGVRNYYYNTYTLSSGERLPLKNEQFLLSISASLHGEATITLVYWTNICAVEAHVGSLVLQTLETYS